MWDNDFVGSLKLSTLKSVILFNCSGFDLICCKILMCQGTHIQESYIFATGSVNAIYIGVGKAGFNCWGVRGTAFVLFLFYVNVSGMRPRSPLSS